jgi:hypothetical protein
MYNLREVTELNIYIKLIFHSFKLMEILEQFNFWTDVSFTPRTGGKKIYIQNTYIIGKFI